jgi:hypothetical protein
MTRPLCSARITELHRYYGPVRPCASRRYSAPCLFKGLGSSLLQPGDHHSIHCAVVGVEATGSHVPYQSLDQARAASMPDTARAALQAAPGLIPVIMQSRVSMSQISRHVISGSLALAFLVLTLHNQVAPFPQRSPPRLLTDAACGGLRPPPAGRSRGALPHLWHSTDQKVRSPTSSPPFRSWHTHVRAV